MPQRWRNILLSLLVAPMLFTACKKQYSSDNPLTPVYTPSIIINSDNQVLYGLNPANGSRNWQFGLPLSIGTPFPAIQFQTSPVLYHNMVYILGNQTNFFLGDTLYKINGATGALVSKFVFTQPGVSFNVQATPVAYGGLIYIATTNDTLYAVDTAKGITQWKYSPGAGTGSMISSPVVHNDTLYGATTGGTVFALAATQTPSTTGAEVSAAWTYQNTNASFYSSPSISSPYLYIGSYMDSNMYCIPTQAPIGSTTNTPRWTYKTHGGIYSSPAAEFGVCVFGSTDFNVYCLDTFLTGTNTSPGARWITPTHSAVQSSPVLVDNVVYIGSNDYNLYAINIIDGSIKWKFASTALIKSSPLVYGSTVYIGSYDKYLYAVDTALGTLKWSYNTNGQIECSPVINDLSGTNEYNSQISGFTN